MFENHDIQNTRLLFLGSAHSQSRIYIFTFTLHFINHIWQRINQSVMGFINTFTRTVHERSTTFRYIDDSENEEIYFSLHVVRYF